MAFPWLPIAGTMKGLALFALMKSTTSLTISTIFFIPLLPTATAILAPGLIRGLSLRSSFETSPLTSASPFFGKCCRILVSRKFSFIDNYRLKYRNPKPQSAQNTHIHNIKILIIHVVNEATTPIVNVPRVCNLYP